MKNIPILSCLRSARILLSFALVAGTVVCVVPGCNKASSPDKSSGDNSGTGKSSAKPSGQTKKQQPTGKQAVKPPVKPPQKAVVGTPTAEVYAALDDAIHRLKTGDFRGFLEHDIPPRELSRLRASDAVEREVARMNRRPQRQRILSVYSAMRGGRNRISTSRRRSPS